MTMVSLVRLQFEGRQLVELLRKARQTGRDDFFGISGRAGREIQRKERVPGGGYGRR